MMICPKNKECDVRTYYSGVARLEFDTVSLNLHSPLIAREVVGLSRYQR